MKRSYPITRGSLRFPWSALLPELKHLIRKDYLDSCADACLAMTCKAESQARTMPKGAADHLAESAARLGHRHLLFYRPLPDTRRSPNCLVFAAADGGQLDILRLLIEERNVIWFTGDVARAAFRGHLHVVQWFFSAYSSFETWPSYIFENAAASGNMDLLKWLHTNRYCGVKSHAHARAIKGGHWHVVEWLCSIGCPKDRWAFSQAAETGDVEKLAWLRDHDFPWDSDCIGKAIVNGGDAVISWFLTLPHPVPWSSSTLRMIMEQPDVGIILRQLEWVLDHGCHDGNVDIVIAREDCFRAAAQYKDPTIIMALWRRGFGRGIVFSRDGGWNQTVALLMDLPSPSPSKETSLLEWLRRNDHFVSR